MRILKRAVLISFLTLAMWALLNIVSAISIEQIYKFAAGLYDLVREYFLVFVGIYMAFVAFFIFLEGQNPDKTLLWLILIIALPFVGFIAYILLGPDLKNRFRRREMKKRKKEHQKQLIKNLENCGVCDCGCDSLTANLLVNDAGAEFTTNNRVQTLIDGIETFGAIKQKISQAKKYINMEYFSIADDEIGNEIADILIERVKAGVKVRVIYDDVGSWSLTRKYVEKLRKAGVEIHAFMPVVFAMLRRGVNYRTHRKIVVIDGQFGFTGGLNIGDMYLGKDPKLGKWRDTHIMIEGESVRSLNEIFIDDWALCAAEKLAPESFRYADCSNLPETKMQIAASGPDKGYRSIAHGFFSIIANARKRVWITTPYLVPGEALGYALNVAAKSGVDVRIIYPVKSDHALVHWASTFFARQKVMEGIKIYSYTDGFVHSKTILIDDDMVSVGTTNLDVRSLDINYEVQAFIYDKETNKIYAEQFLRDLEKCTEQTIEAINNRTFLEKIKEAIGRLWSNLL